MPVRLSKAARRDLAGIWTYSAKRWGQAQADRYIRLLSAGFDGLASGVAMGRPVPEVEPGYLKHAVGSHVVFYRSSAPGTVDVVRVLHERMDVERHL